MAGWDVRRAVERSGVWIREGSAGWTVAAVLMIVMVAMLLGFDPSGGSSAETAGTLPRDEALLGPTVDLSDPSASASTATASTTIAPTRIGEWLTIPTDVEPSSSNPNREPDRSVRVPVVSQTLPTRAVTTAAPPTEAPTTQGTAAPTTAPIATTVGSTAGGSTATVAPTTQTSASTTSTTVPATAPSTTISSSSVVIGNDVYEVASGKGGKFKILENDGGGVDLDEDTLQIVVGPAHAEKYRVHNDHIHYESDDDYEGTDSLRYRVCTVDGACGTATVTIRVIDD